MQHTFFVVLQYLPSWWLFDTVSAIAVNSLRAVAINKIMNNNFTNLMIMFLQQLSCYAIWLVAIERTKKIRPEQDSNPNLCDSYTGVFM